MDRKLEKKLIEAELKKPLMKKEIVLAAIVGVTVIEVTAIFHGINGTLMKLCIGAICALAGVMLPNPWRVR